MLRFIKGFVVAVVIAFLAVGLSSVSASAATGPAPTCASTYGTGWVGTYPLCKSPANSDPAQQGNAPLGGGKNVSSGPGPLVYPVSNGDDRWSSILYVAEVLGIVFGTAAVATLLIYFVWSRVINEKAEVLDADTHSGTIL
jgi:hypothetical protein